MSVLKKLGILGYLGEERLDGTDRQTSECSRTHDFMFQAPIGIIVIVAMRDRRCGRVHLYIELRLAKVLENTFSSWIHFP